MVKIHLFRGGGKTIRGRRARPPEQLAATSGRGAMTLERRIMIIMLNALNQSAR
jgi:hypothetical protein